MTIEVVFDGKVFVPTGPVDLPAGTRGVAQTVELKPPPPMTAEDQRLWDEIMRQVQNSEPPFPTVEETMAYVRGRPWPYLLQPFTPPPPPGEWAPPGGEA